MLKITIAGVPPFDGEYELDVEQQYNGHELHLIKKVAGVRLGEIPEAAAAGDYDLTIALAVIALWRGGTVTKASALEAADHLLSATAGLIRLEEEVDADPPASAQKNGNDASNETDAPSDSSANDSSSTGDAHQETTPALTGSPG